jgi:hypothetical protein
MAAALAQPKDEAGPAAVRVEEFDVHDVVGRTCVFTVCWIPSGHG